MKKFFEGIDVWRWIGFLLALLGAFVLSNANVETQWLGWVIICVSGVIWIYMAYKDGDTPRGLMEIMYLILGLRAIWNWISS